MIRYSIKNLLTQPVRSVLCVVGISIAVIGVVCIFSFSEGLKATVKSAIHLVDGVVVLQKNRPDPTISSVPLRLEEELEKHDRIKNVIPWIWTIPGSIEHRSLTQRSIMTPELLGGVDVDDISGDGKEPVHLYQKTLIRGRFLTPGDDFHIVISERLSERHSVGVGETLLIDGASYEVVGLYRTGNKIMDMAIVMPMKQVRTRRNLDENHVSDLFVVGVEGTSRKKLVDFVEQKLISVDKQALEKWDVRTRDEWESDFSNMMGEVETFLLLISSLAVVVGTVGIINTMLMSVTERTSEFGILVANGWAKSDIVRLVMCESTLLGIVSGVVGTGTGWLAVQVVNYSIALSIDATTPFSLLVSCFLMAVVIGVIGGIYPAYQASNKHPIEAIRSIR